MPDIILYDNIFMLMKCTVLHTESKFRRTPPQGWEIGIIEEGNQYQAHNIMGGGGQSLQGEDLELGKEKKCTKPPD